MNAEHKQATRERLMRAYEAACEERSRSFPHGKPPVGMRQGWDDRTRAIKDAAKRCQENWD